MAVFTCCIFVTGLTRASVRLLAANPPECGPTCVALPVATLCVLAGLILGAVADLKRLHRKHGHLVSWKPAARPATPSAIGDPWMRWRAEARVRAVSAQILAAERARERALGLGRCVSSLSLPLRRSMTGLRAGSHSGGRIMPAAPAPTGSSWALSSSELSSGTGSGASSSVTSGAYCGGEDGSSERRRVAFSDGFRSRPSAPDGFHSRPSPPPSPPPSTFAVREPQADFAAPAPSPPEAVRRLQAAQRGAAARRSLQLRRDAALQTVEEERAAHAIQGLFRSWRARESMQRARAAGIVQRHVRGRVARQQAAARTQLQYQPPPAPSAAYEAIDGQGDHAGLSKHPSGKTLISGPPTGAAPRRRLSARDARSSALERLAARGHRDRKSGTWAVAGPEEDAAEPGRTERILAAPFALWRARPVDAFQSREGFFMFRVHGRYFFGRWYRILVLAVNMVFGVLSGLQPLMPAGSRIALVQTALVLTLQLSMALLCFRFLPDADRIISRFAATQFLLEGLSTSMLLASSLSHAGGGDVAGSAAAASAEAVDAGASLSTAASRALLDSGFAFSLAAMLVPMLQLLEQRLITPGINIVVNRGCNPLVILAAGYMLAASLPRKVANLIRAIQGFDGFDASAAAGSATADAGDDAVEAELQPVEAASAAGGDTSTGESTGASRETTANGAIKDGETGMQREEPSRVAAAPMAAAASHAVNTLADGLEEYAQEVVHDLASLEAPQPALEQREEPSRVPVPQADHMAAAASHAANTLADGLEEYAQEINDLAGLETPQPAHEPGLDPPPSAGGELAKDMLASGEGILVDALAEVGDALAEDEEEGMEDMGEPASVSPSESAAPAGAAPPIDPLMTGDQVADAGVRASRLLARALAAKEVAGKKMASPNPLEPTMEEESEPPAATEGLNLGGLRAVAHLRKQQEARKRSNAAADEEGADGDDGD